MIPDTVVKKEEEEEEEEEEFIRLAHFISLGIYVN